MRKSYLEREISSAGLPKYPFWIGSKSVKYCVNTHKTAYLRGFWANNTQKWVLSFRD